MSNFKRGYKQRSKIPSQISKTPVIKLLFSKPFYNFQTLKIFPKVNLKLNFQNRGLKYLIKDLKLFNLEIVLNNSS